MVIEVLAAIAEAQPWYIAVSMLLLVPFLAIEQARIQQQRYGVQLVRDWLSRERHWRHVIECGAGWDSEQGFIVMVHIWIAFLFLTAMSFVFEGRLVQCMSVMLITSTFVASLVTKQPRWRIAAMGRLMLVHQLLAMSSNAPFMASVLVRRMILMRGVGVLIFVESLEEGFVHLFSMTLALDYFHREHPGLPLTTSVVYMPLMMFFLCVLPMHVTGVSEWLSASCEVRALTTDMSTKLFKAIGIVACIAPLHIIFSSYLATSARQVPLLVGFSFLVGGLLLRIPVVGRVINHRLAPHTLALHRQHSSSEEEAWRERLRVRFINCAYLGFSVGVWALGRQIAFLLCVSLGVVLIMRHTNRLLYSLSQSRLWLLTGTALLLARGEAWLSGNLVFLGFISSFLCVLMNCARELMYVRIAHENEVESFLSHAIKQKFAAVGAAVEQILLCKSERMPELLYTVVDECRMGHARCYASSIYRKLEQGEPRHTSKRRFADLEMQMRDTTMASSLVGKQTVFSGGSGAGGAEASLVVLAELDWEIVHLVLTDFARMGRKLRRVWWEEEADGDGARLYLQWNRPIHRMNVILACLMIELNGKWESGSDTCVFQTRIMRAPQPSPMHHCPASAAVTLPPPSSDQLAAAPPPLTLTTAASIVSAPSARFQLSRGGTHELLCNLRFALVDDNALIRKNFVRLLQNNLGVPHANILSCGETALECRSFAQRICDENVDVAIFDQNLDYDDDDEEEEDEAGEVAVESASENARRGKNGSSSSLDNNPGHRDLLLLGKRHNSSSNRNMLKGSDLAQEAKRLGFNGCLILHSSDVNLPLLLEQGVFHGAVEKSADSAKFVEGIVSALSCFRGKI